MDSAIEQFAKDEMKPGVSAGAAARQLCRSLGASGMAPTLKTMIETLLGEANHQAFDRSQILKDFREAAPDAAAVASMKSFNRMNSVKDAA